MTEAPRGGKIGAALRRTKEKELAGGLWKTLRANGFYRNDNPVYLRISRLVLSKKSRISTGILIFLAYAGAIAVWAIGGLWAGALVAMMTGGLISLLLYLRMIFMPALTIVRERSEDTWGFLLLTGIDARRALWGFIMPCVFRALVVVVILYPLLLFGQAGVLAGAPSRIGVSPNGEASPAFCAAVLVSNVIAFPTYFFWMVLIGVVAAWRALENRGSAGAVLTAIGILLLTNIVLGIPLGIVNAVLSAAMGFIFHDPVIPFLFVNLIQTILILVLLNFVVIPFFFRLAVKSFRNFYFEE